MEWLLLFLSIEFGYLPQGDFVMYEPNLYSRYRVDNYFYTDMEVEIQIADFLFFGGGIKTIMFFDGTSGSISFFPYSSNYKMFAGLRYNMIEIGFRHYCVHPVLPWFGIGWYADFKWEGAYEEIYIKISNK